MPPLQGLKMGFPILSSTTPTLPSPFPFLDIHGGYKSFIMDIDEDEVVFDYDMSGPYVALTLSF